MIAWTAPVLGCAWLAACGGGGGGSNAEGNVTETASDGVRRGVAVVDSEGRSVEAQPLTYVERDGLVSIEAETFRAARAGSDLAADSHWVQSDAIGSSSGPALTAAPNDGVDTGEETVGPRLDYRVEFEGEGTFYVWVRMRGESSEDDSVHVGLDGAQISSGGRGVGDQRPGWYWEEHAAGRRLALRVPAAGAHVLNLWMREDGTIIDKIVLARDERYEPEGRGPEITLEDDATTDDDDHDHDSTVAGDDDATDGDDSTVADGDETTNPGDDGALVGDDGVDTGDDGTSTGDDGTSAGGDDPNTDDDGAVACLRARKLWSDDFETGDYSRWTSNGYVSVLNQGGCYQSDFSTDQANGGERSHRTSIGCASAQNHRIYGGLQFAGDEVLPNFTNAGSGIDAENGIVVTYSSWLDAPGFGDGRWFSFFTTNNMCNHSDTVVTFGLEDSSNQISPAHIQSTGGSLQEAATRSAFPFRQWVRTTVYVNYHAGEFHVWQDGVSQVHGTFRRSTNQICQIHWGLYANGANTAITLFEDDYSIWKLDEPLTEFESEPWLGESQPTCE